MNSMNEALDRQMFSQLVKKTHIYGTPNSTTVFTRACLDRMRKLRHAYTVSVEKSDG
jgi:hypothetical protein